MHFLVRLSVPPLAFSAEVALDCRKEEMIMIALPFWFLVFLFWFLL